MLGVQISSVINKIQIVAEPCSPDEPGVNLYRFRLIHAAIDPLLGRMEHAKLHGTITCLCVLGLQSRRGRASPLGSERHG